MKRCEEFVKFISLLKKYSEAKSSLEIMLKEKLDKLPEDIINILLEDYKIDITTKYILLQDPNEFEKYLLDKTLVIYDKEETFKREIIVERCCSYLDSEIEFGSYVEDIINISPMIDETNEVEEEKSVNPMLDFVDFRTPIIEPKFNINERHVVKIISEVSTIYYDKLEYGVYNAYKELYDIQYVFFIYIPDMKYIDKYLKNKLKKSKSKYIK